MTGTLEKVAVLHVFQKLAPLGVRTARGYVYNAVVGTSIHCGRCVIFKPRRVSERESNIFSGALIFFSSFYLAAFRIARAPAAIVPHAAECKVLHGEKYRIPTSRFADGIPEERSFHD